MPPKTKTKTPARAVTTVTVSTPEPAAGPTDQTFTWGGQSYTAHMPKDFVYLEIGAAWAPGATPMAKAKAISLFIRACLSPADRDRIEERMITASSIDPARGMELLVEIDKLSEVWRPYIEGEFETANLRATSAR